MKTFIITGLCVFGLTFPKLTSESGVYVCGNSSTKVYHTYKSCGALKKCQYETLYMSKSEAISSGLRECRWRTGCGR